MMSWELLSENRFATLYSNKNILRHLRPKARAWAFSLLWWVIVPARFDHSRSWIDTEGDLATSNGLTHFDWHCVAAINRNAVCDHCSTGSIAHFAFSCARLPAFGYALSQAIKALLLNIGCGIAKTSLRAFERSRSDRKRSCGLSAVKTSIKELSRSGYKTDFTFIRTMCPTFFELGTSPSFAQCVQLSSSWAMAVMLKLRHKNTERKRVNIRSPE
jgi:hypothetical protein